MKKGYKKRKWYSYKNVPPNTISLVVMTDMGYIFEAFYDGENYHLSVVENDKVYFPVYEYQECIFRWMIV